ncbi:uncharacterized protein B0I36DRAFT_54286 [Microdochium trichocladiopsis]|uniref:Uncharacterized protein n=1 Tax=Microdochium trichocladiopsis TaxID=1682393 RepID=A0A9P9BHN1_9PEZI|nr:uncharacterized protein B0I36DRAFT_54286 [Microdochium trichocladiopsis]KAH7012076.1 hypothetical protein B0I36DRAFT_54286 [Microdochium trichocladiopsis]
MAPLKPGFAVLPQHVEEIEMGIREAISNSRAPFGRTTQQRRPIEKRRHDTEARPLKQSSGLAKRRRMSCERGATKEAEERCAAATFIAQSITDVSDTAGEESFRTAEPEQNPKPEDNSEPVVIGSDGLPHTAPTTNPAIRSLVLRNFTLRPSGGLSPVLFEALLRGMPELTDLSLEGRVMIQNKQCPEEFAILSTCEIIGAIRAGAPNVLRFHFEKSPLPGALQHSSISKN